MIRLPGGQTQRHMLPPNQPVTIGRKQGNLIVVNFPGVSGNHMRLDSSAGAMTITDLNSTNGTELNGRRIPPNSPHPLAVGDIIRVGDGLGNSIRMSLEGSGPPKLRTLPLGMMALAQATTVTIGRDPNSTLPLNHPGVSQRHAMVERQNGALFIRDLGSTNGTFVNGQRLAGRVQLSPGDEIQIGPFKLVYDAAQQSFAQAVRLGHRLDAVGLGLQVAKGRMILNNISVCIQPGEFVSLVGGSGAGKSTLLKSMNGYSPANHGQMLLDGEELYPRLDMYRAQMGYVPQDDIIHRELTVDRALYYSAKLRLPDASPAEIQERIMDALKMVDMTEHVHKRVRVLSGGQRKRVSIAAELLAKPTLFFSTSRPRVWTPVWKRG